MSLAGVTDMRQVNLSQETKLRSTHRSEHIEEVLLGCPPVTAGGCSMGLLRLRLGNDVAIRVSLVGHPDRMLRNISTRKSAS
jgi:hypothetical protein